ncbi:uncharacterized protein LOC111713811 [Eurytemora carolleeae]|uniref:uncharacterized protein LOC111713811 n=1 Tax=Eurytemora carolleeae TaxID=1294199 RepID=UPI000C76B315|nr:uncharacterized protein LOC111713811 [Eurytemora carolleeae]|eukprot:XP_023344522.1 uncharacterized protein LOC111713811 [Eurytemora affinis]
MVAEDDIPTNPGDHCIRPRSKSEAGTLKRRGFLNQLILQRKHVSASTGSGRLTNPLVSLHPSHHPHPNPHNQKEISPEYSDRSNLHPEKRRTERGEEEPSLSETVNVFRPRSKSDAHTIIRASKPPSIINQFIQQRKQSSSSVSAMMHPLTNIQENSPLLSQPDGTSDQTEMEPGTKPEPEPGPKSEPESFRKYSEPVSKSRRDSEDSSSHHSSSKFRPRSKSDATHRPAKRPNFLNQLILQRKHGSSAGFGGGRPNSPLVQVILNDIQENPVKVVEQDEEQTEPGETEEETEPFRKRSSTMTEVKEFRARALSAGQHARAHVSSIVAKIRRRSNSNADEKKKKIRCYPSSDFDLNLRVGCTVHRVRMQFCSE